MVWTQILLNMKIALINWNFQEREKNAWRNQSWANCQFPNFCPRKLDFGKERLLEPFYFRGLFGPTATLVERLRQTRCCALCMV